MLCAAVSVLRASAAGDPGIAAQLLLLLSAGQSVLPAVPAYVSGILWELAASSAAAEQLLVAGAVPALIRVVQETAPLVVGSGGGRKKGGKKPKKGGKARDKSGGKAAAGKQDAGCGKGRKDGKAAAAGAAAGRQGSQAGCVGEVCAGPSFTLLQDPQAAAEVALCNAAGEAGCAQAGGGEAKVCMEDGWGGRSTQPCVQTYSLQAMHQHSSLCSCLRSQGMTQCCVLQRVTMLCCAVVCCAGALHHLSFLDGAKAQVGQSSHLHLLVTLASSTQVGGDRKDNKGRLVGIRGSRGSRGRTTRK
jgi:hypothetical protein